MWTQWSITRLVRWRVKDWASCFTACRFPLGKSFSFFSLSTIKVTYQEDGAFDVVKDGKSEASSSSNHIDCTRRNSWPVNRKINFGEDATNEAAEIIAVKEDEEEDVVYLDIESAATASNNRIRYQTEGMVSVESSDSNRSDNSTASFAFPVLGWEWMGSPAQMPKSEGLHLRRKHKARSLNFQCCRF
ncbi:hypothetical protein JRO89_XS13G0005000 [Xanthoceras sorbifolium]|uniref:Uncharacterized protein n=1 Tax=Xanthoceras sorbifolium TaxID=99658 RepID=A0ABQ8H5R2_9ROSI|nr:hypothetical protein JRO89_XS13G0005000 [Xanthoceras sorbifolium]